jgi:hypothetical protein
MVGGICPVIGELAIYISHQGSIPQLAAHGCYSRSMKAIKRPVRPPIFPRAFPKPLAAPLIAGPAAEATFDRPSEAFDLYSEAVCDALDAVSFAASVALLAVDSNRADVRPTGSFADRRKTARESAIDIVRGEIHSIDRRKWLNRF